MRKSRTKTKRESRAVWSKRYQHWQTSGLSKVGFCKQNKINTTCFYYWCKLFRHEPLSKQKMTPAHSKAPRFLPVEITDANVTLMIECNDVKISCSSALSGEQLYEWVKALRRATCSG